MNDREKVIAKLQILRTWCAVNPEYNKGLCIEDCRSAVEWLDNALELLKSQEPRVMTYDELVTFDGAFLLESCGVLSELDWVFFFDTDSKSDAIWVEGFDGERCVVYREDYGQYARCWTSRPTDEQREAAAWQKPENN